METTLDVRQDEHRDGGLWSPTRLGCISLRHRLVMAPMTRSRAAKAGS